MMWTQYHNVARNRVDIRKLEVLSRPHYLYLNLTSNSKILKYNCKNILVPFCDRLIIKQATEINGIRIIFNKSLHYFKTKLQYVCFFLFWQYFHIFTAIFVLVYVMQTIANTQREGIEAILKVKELMTQWHIVGDACRPSFSVTETIREGNATVTIKYYVSEKKVAHCHIVNIEIGCQQ